MATKTKHIAILPEADDPEVALPAIVVPRVNTTGNASVANAGTGKCRDGDSHCACAGSDDCKESDREFLPRLVGSNVHDRRRQCGTRFHSGNSYLPVQPAFFAIVIASRYMELDRPARETQRSPCRSEVYSKRGVRRTWAVANPGTTLPPGRRVDILCRSLVSSGPRDFATSIRIPRSHTHPGSSRLRAGWRRYSSNVPTSSGTLIASRSRMPAYARMRRSGITPMRSDSDTTCRACR